MRNILLISVAMILSSAMAFSSSGGTIINIIRRHYPSYTSTRLFVEPKKEAYTNKIAEALSNFLPKSSSKVEDDPFAGSVIDWNAPKVSKKGMSLEALAQTLDAELYEKEWFVTGSVNPIYFSNDFRFSDPDVAVDGIEGKQQRQFYVG